MFKRFRRLRLNGSIRSLVRETRLSMDDIIYPLFITGGRDVKIGSDLMSGVYRMSIDRALSECQAILDCGIRSVMLFGVTDDKDSTGSESLNPDGLLASSVREIKSNFPALFLIADVCFCEYTDHGHCGLLDSATVVDNDGTLKLLQEQSLLLARSGADMVAPSAMMDGQVESIRSALDSNGFASVPIMSYSTKFASSYYGPFRDIALSRPSFGSRESYQMDCANRREAILESLHDEIQGADILMVKPALAYLDVVREIRDRTLLPLALYNVSGEYALLKAGQKLGVIDYERMLMENMISFKRAGADLIITYHAKEVAQILSR